LQTVNKERSATTYIEENENDALLEKVMPFEKLMQVKTLKYRGIIKE